MVMTFFLLTACAGWQDTVLLSTTGSTGRSKLIGQIVDYTGRVLRIELASGRTQTVPAGQVSAIQTRYAAEQNAADAAYEKGAFEPALAGYRRALAVEPRAWVRKLILAEIVGCQRVLGQELPACTQFLELAAEHPPYTALAAIPLVWSDPPVMVEMLVAAQGWLARTEQPAAVLLGASRLLATAERSKAIEALQRVAAGGDRALADLATAQLWRLRVATATSAELDQWEATLLDWPEPLRAGPYFVLGQGRAHHSQWSAAALAWLRVPLQYPRQRALAAEALRNAGRALEKLGATDEARRLFQEATERFGAKP